MSEPSVKEITRSSDSMEALFRLSVQRWAFAAGRVNFGKMLGVGTSRLNRAMSGASPSLDLAYRIHTVCGVSWPGLFTGAFLDGSNQSVIEAKKTGKLPPTAEEVAEAETRARLKIKELATEIGFTECWQKTGIARATFHSYLMSTRPSLALVWRMHLLTGVPYSFIIDGQEDETESKLRESLGKPDNFSGRFGDLLEPVIQLVEVGSYHNMTDIAGPHIGFIGELLSGELTLPQKIRLTTTLAVYWYELGELETAESYITKEWRALEKAGVESLSHFLTLRHAAIAMKIGEHKHAEEVTWQIMELTENPRIVSQFYRLLAEIALMRLNIFEATRLLRKAINICMDIESAPQTRDMIISRLEVDLIICAWASGDYREALSRMTSLLESSSAGFSIKGSFTEIEIYIRIWLGDISGTERAIKEFNKSSTSTVNVSAFRRTLDLFRLRLLLRKKDCGEKLSTGDKKKLNALLDEASLLGEKDFESDSFCVWAICMYYANDEKKYLKQILSKLVSGKRFFKGTPLFALPDFVEAVRKAGLWSKKCEQWQKKKTEEGLFVFNMRRPGEL
ncbi:MAG: hypothetical protein E3J72_22095 [Planctomycetota bacterium]|nr:MAG: hypothetical protein E3J72_22095 [Planctomycetota bacterium]